MNDVLVQKITSLQRCVRRARDARARADKDFSKDFDMQDVAIHQYRDLNPDIVISVIDQGLDDLLTFSEIAHQTCQP